MKDETQVASSLDLKRRQLLIGGSTLALALALPATTFAAAGTAAANNKDIDMQDVTFNNNGITMAGNVYYPEGFDAGRKYPAIVSVHPGGGVKEQTAGLYARRLAEQGFVALAFDASHQGASGGEPRLLDDPMRRVGDIFSAVDYLTSLPFVDADRIGALGICAGSGAAVKASTMDRRIKALVTVSAVDVGAATRKGWDGTANEADQLATLEAVAQQRTAEAAGAAPAYGNYVPAIGDTTAPMDLQEAADYYLTPRGQHPNAPNRMLLTSVPYLVSFTGFDRVDTLLTQPVLIVAGDKAGSLWHSQELYANAASTSKELAIIEGATHMDLYDGPGSELAMERVAPFFLANV
nr:alpha/beta hydrolase [uncultured Devosia sp.]